MKTIDVTPTIFDIDTAHKNAMEFAQYTLDQYGQEWKSLLEAKNFKELELSMEKVLSSYQKHLVAADLILEEEGSDTYKENMKYLEGFGLTQKIKLTRKFIGLLALHRRMSLTMMSSSLLSLLDDGNYVAELKEFYNKVIDAGLCTFEKGMFIVTPITTLNDAQMNSIAIRQSNLPMLCKPHHCHISKNGRIYNGYLALNKTVFSDGADEHTDIPLDFLDAQNMMPYEINYDVWENYIEWNPKLPEIEEDDPLARKKILSFTDHYMRKVALLHIYKTLGIKRIWIPNMYDYRGRNYPISYLINPQGTDDDKALLKFPARLMTLEGEKWLKISIANCYNCKYKGQDLDKNTFIDRLAWYDETIAPLMALPMEEFLVKLNQMAKEADSPACFWAQMHNMKCAEDADGITNQPQVWAITHFDATASGYQILSCCLRDEATAKLVNVNSDGDYREDLYTVIYNQCKERGLDPKHTRADIKRKALMPYLYGGKKCVKDFFKDDEQFNIFEGVMMSYTTCAISRGIAEYWDSNMLEYHWFLPDGFKVYKKVMDKASEEFEYNGYVGTFEQMVNKPRKKSIELGPNVTHSLDGFIARELSRRLNYNPKKFEEIKALLRSGKSNPVEDEHGSRKLMAQLLELGKKANFYSTRILWEINEHNVDMVPEDVLIEVLCQVAKAPCPISEIHDSFGVPPNHAAVLMNQYKNILSDIATSFLLESVLKYLDINLNNSQSEKTIQTFAKKVLDSRYPLC